ncbi:MAG: SH3 domain-containing protein [Candidatus Ventricola sp.]|nr:SH3 domain-containing protein [Candidatus Ventricola sp.]
MDRRWGRGLALMLAVLVLCLTLPPAALAESGVAAGSTVSGTVRVYLSSIGSLTKVDLTVDGSYSIGGDTSRAIARGTQLSVSNSGGTLLLAMGGQTQTMGSRFKLRRHQTSGSNGVRIAQARYPQNLYPGDIEFIAKGGYVQIVVHVFMEDYMCGVLPYELDNSFPLEALKAQAVAARTYALKKMSAQAATYDLVDTTSDQVYNGTPSGNARCMQAVQETGGIVGTVNGEYMASYYTASNGGQTESVANAWGSGSYSYLTIKDDPYDLNNSASIAKSVTLYHDGTTSVSALTELLRTEAAALVGAGSVKIAAITGVRVHTPKYGEPSRVYRKVDVDLTLAGYGDVTVTLDYFDQVEGLCGLSINVLKNETLSVSQTASGFKLTARRYGHGVGMSQRGAQQMAREGMTYDQILEFYYPGLVRTRYTMTRTILPSLDGTGDAGSEPVADAKSAVVTLSNPLDCLNLRREASTSSAILATMAHGTQVTLLEMGSTWSRVQYGTLSGYVKNEYISVIDDAVDETPEGVVSLGTAVVSLADESQTLNLRAAPTVNSAVLSHLRHGQTLTVLERYERWTQVQMGSLTGYVSNDYILFSQAETESTPAPQATPAPVTETMTAIVLPEGGLNLRTSASRTAGVIMTLPQGTMLRVTGTPVDGMLPVALGDLTGFVASEYVFTATDEELGLTASTPTPVPTTTASPQQSTATVTARSGLKLRSMPDASGQVLATMPLGTQVTLLGPQQNGFYPVRYGDAQGYASAAYLSVDTGAQAPVPTAVPTAAPTATPRPSQPVAGRTATVTAASGLNLRADSNTYSDVVAMLAYGVEVVVTGEAVDGFYPVRVGTLSGYVSADYLRFGEHAVQPTATPAPTTAPQTGAYRVVVESDNGLNLRAAPNTASDVVYVLPYGMVLTVLDESENGFLHVQWANYTGYVSGEFVTPFGTQ